MQNPHDNHRECPSFSWMGIKKQFTWHVACRIIYGVYNTVGEARFLRKQRFPIRRSFLKRRKHEEHESVKELCFNKRTKHSDSGVPVTTLSCSLSLHVWVDHMVS